MQWTAVQFAAWVGNPEAIEILVEHGANVNFADAVKTGSQIGCFERVC